MKAYLGCAGLYVSLPSYMCIPTVLRIAGPGLCGVCMLTKWKERASPVNCIV